MKKVSKINRRTLLKQMVIGGASAMMLPTTGMSAIGKVDRTAQNDEGHGFTFLFQGDSITDGNRSRNNDWNHVMGHGYAYLIASRLWYDHPAKEFRFYNRGVSGNTLADLTARWQADTLDLRPALVSILVGVNDVNRIFDKVNPKHEPAATFGEHYRALIAYTKEHLAGVRMVLCEPFLLPVGKVKENWEAWSTEMKSRQDVVRGIAAGTGSIFVPLQDAFNKSLERAPAEYWIWDGIHPMPAGHELIARRWIDVVGRELDFIR